LLNTINILFKNKFLETSDYYNKSPRVVTNRVMVTNRDIYLNNFWNNNFDHDSLVWIACVISFS